MDIISEVYENVSQTYNEAIEKLIDQNEGAMALWLKKCMNDAQTDLANVWKRFSDI